MSCEATPAHASEPFEWRIRQRSRHGSRFSEAERRRTALLQKSVMSCTGGGGAAEPVP